MSTPPPAIEKKVISEVLHSEILSIFFLGAHTVVYLGTAYVYLTQKGPTSQRRVVLSTITLLYLLYLSTVISNWYQIHYMVVDHGETRDSMFLSLIMPPRWINICGNASQDLMFIIADGLMIWRCFHLWGGSWRVILVPAFLTLAELGLLIDLFIAYFYEISIAFTDINSAIYFISAGSTTISTLLIGWRFHVTTSAAATSALKPTGSGRYRYILLVLFESAAIYTVCIIGMAILTVTPPANYFAAPIMQATIYVSTITPTIAVGLFPLYGIAPTILVARVVMAKSKSFKTSYAHGPSMAVCRTQPLSAIDFGRPSKLPDLAGESDTQLQFNGTLGDSFHRDVDLEACRGMVLTPNVVSVDGEAIMSEK